MTEFATGQRWISETEPELGLGTVLKMDIQTVSVLFQTNGTIRQYSRESAPLKRLRFHAGDTIKSHDGRFLVVTKVAEDQARLVYHCDEHIVPESELSDTLSFNTPAERMMTGQLDGIDKFDLRQETLEVQHWRRKSEMRGFVGGRIELIPHQIYIAREVASRHAPRVLLSDEVGLGKTIESCLIVHRMLVSGRARRVLILVPETLVHQWFVELFRRFNLWFNIFDEDRCEAIESANPEINPFLDDQLALCNITFLAQNEKRRNQALAAEWDMLLVDEAHHLNWTQECPSAEYSLVEAFSERTSGLLLLTATPEQFGLESHFARLRLLDPERYPSFEAFRKEATDYQPVAEIAGKLLQEQKLTAKDRKTLAELFSGESPSTIKRADQAAGKNSEARSDLITDLIDRHGTGRVMFRNTRAAMSGFPKREVHLVPLANSTEDDRRLDSLADEFSLDTQSHQISHEGAIHDFHRDPRILWLANLLRELKGAKILLICRTKEKVSAIDLALRETINVKTGQFHEELSLLQRDRNAAWFAEEDGASLLLCSEIGSEGRNFQFAHHLVLFDLPHDPELLEQRIGRLDRIGQTSDIHIYVPFISGSSQSVLVRWFQDGLNAFAQSLHAGREMFERFGKRVNDLALDFHETLDETGLESLVKETAKARCELLEQLEKGRDRLLELNSFRPAEAHSMVEKIVSIDQDPHLEDFMLRVFDNYGIQVEEISTRTYRVGSNGVFVDGFPSLPKEGLTATCDRRRALGREDIAFLTWDHPIVTGAMDLILGSESGNSSYAWWPDSNSRSILIEAIYLLECLAPEHLHAERFLAPTPIRVVIDQNQKDCTSDCPTDQLRKALQSGDAFKLLDRSEVKHSLLPDMLKKAQELAASLASETIRRAQTETQSLLGHEVERLKALRQINRNVRLEEIELAERQFESIQEHVSEARLRMDALRLIWRGPRL